MVFSTPDAMTREIGRKQLKPGALAKHPAHAMSTNRTHNHNFRATHALPAKAMCRISEVADLKLP
jgi:hypothetical protein